MAIRPTSYATVGLTFRADGSFVYTPAADFTGSDAFTYRAHDGTFESNPATVTIDVHAGAALVYSSSTGSFQRAPGETITVTLGVQGAAEEMLGFQLDFAGAAGELALSNWATDTAAWLSVLDGHLDTAGDNPIALKGPRYIMGEGILLQIAENRQRETRQVGIGNEGDSSGATVSCTIARLGEARVVPSLCAA